MLNFVMKKMMEKQLKGLPKDQQEKIINAFQKDPELFKNIAKEVKELTKKGQNEQMASMTVMMKYQNRLRELMK